MSLSSAKSMLASGVIFEPPEQQSIGSPPKRRVPNDQKTKRLSLNLPIQPMEYPPITSSPTTLASPTMVSPTGQRLPSPTQSSSFMVALAAQERRVLELKEELQRAESELAELKRQWAVREAQRKRDDIRQARQLQPLNVPLKEVEGGGGGEEIDGRANIQNAHERRKTTSVGSRPSHRKVIAGQRHTRTLSLLSPDRLNGPPFAATPKSAAAVHDSRFQGPGAARPSLSSAANTVPANSSVEARERAAKLQEPPEEVLLRTGRQMAEDLKEGLWTFIDDLRQVTIGDARGSGRHARKRQVHPATASVGGSENLDEAQDGERLNSQRYKNAKGSGRRRSTVDGRANAEDPILVEVGEVFWREHPVKESYELDERKIPNKERSLISCIELDTLEEKEAWEAWGSPKSDGESVRPSK